MRSSVASNKAMAASSRLRTALGIAEAAAFAVVSSDHAFVAADGRLSIRLGTEVSPGRGRIERLQTVVVNPWIAATGSKSASRDRQKCIAPPG